MRRALRVFSAVTAVLACASAALGLLAVRGQRLAMAAAEGAVMPDRGGLEIAHGLVSHAVSLTACGAAAIAFLLGLHGLLETGGRRARAALLAALGPLLMGMGLAAELTGLRGWREVPVAVAAAEHHAFLRSHAVVPGAGFVVAALALTVAAWVLVRPDRPGAGEGEESDDA